MGSIFWDNIWLKFKKSVPEIKVEVKKKFIVLFDINFTWIEVKLLWVIRYFFWDNETKSLASKFSI